MAQTKIEWTHLPRPDGTHAPGYTFNPWYGCEQIDPGCANCYAKAIASRFGLAEWGPHGTRRAAREETWSAPHNWNAAAAQVPERRAVFTASMADVFEDWPRPLISRDGASLWHCPQCTAWLEGARHETQASTPTCTKCDIPTKPLTMQEARRRLFHDVIDQTRNLIWIIATKRPANVSRLTPAATDWPTDQRGNLWILASANDQATFDAAAANVQPLNRFAAVRGISLEPMTAPVDVSAAAGAIDWLTIGGESGPHARPCHVDWISAAAEQAAAAGIPVFIKQLGGHVISGSHVRIRHYSRDSKGADLAKWPGHLRQYRQFPSILNREASF